MGARLGGVFFFSFFSLFFFTYLEDDVTPHDAAEHDENAAAEDDEEGESAPGGQVGAPEHGDGDGEEVEVGGDVEGEGGVEVELGDCGLAEVCAASDVSRGLGAGARVAGSYSGVRG